jgi:positive regulator of sigma E activity
MIEEYGVVRATDGQETTVEITMPGECESCDAHEACRRAGGLLTARSRDTVSVGQSVRLRVKGVSLLGATSVVYGLPLAALFLGLLAGYFSFISRGEDLAVGMATAIGVICLVFAGMIVRALDAKLGARVRYDVQPISTESKHEGRAVGKA